LKCIAARFRPSLSVRVGNALLEHVAGCMGGPTGKVLWCFAAHDEGPEDSVTIWKMCSTSTPFFLSYSGKSGFKTMLVHSLGADWHFLQEHDLGINRGKVQGKKAATLQSLRKSFGVNSWSFSQNIVNVSPTCSCTRHAVCSSTPWRDRSLTVSSICKRRLATGPDALRCRCWVINGRNCAIGEHSNDGRPPGQDAARRAW